MSNTSPDVVFVLPTYEGGGAERVVLSVARELHLKGRGVLVVGLLEHASFAKLPDLPSIGLGCRRVMAAVWPLRRLLLLRRPQVVVSTLKHVSLMVALVRLLTGRAFVHVIRVANTYSRELAHLSAVRRGVWRRALQLCHRGARRSICVSSGVQADLVNVFGLCVADCRLIQNPVDLARLDEMAAQPVADPPWPRAGRRLVLTAGRLTPQKDFETLIQALHGLRDRAPPCDLLILGEGPQRGALEALVSRLQLDEVVHLPGWVANPYPLFRSADVFVLSSRFEGMPNVLLEALAFGLPVVSTDCESGPRDILRDPSHGELVPVGDVGAMAEALLRALRERKDDARREYVASRFAIRGVVDEYERAIFE